MQEGSNKADQCRGSNSRLEIMAGNREMTDDPLAPAVAASDGTRKPLTAAAQRALAEADARRRAAEANARPMPKEFQGPKGPEPTRYGDWENKGIASDF
jgi:hypothetical protein